MKYLLVLAFLLPSVSLAAPLTQDQATSLISVVQSSPVTPAGAFTDLITTFSSITVSQAESLINVIQQAPGAPAEAFVSLLISFTVDPTPTVQHTVPESVPVFGSTQPVSTSTAPEPTAWTQVKVVPSFTSTHGHLYSSKDAAACIQYGSTKNCSSGVPVFTAPVGQSYQISFIPPPGYSYEADAGCAGTPQEEKEIVCSVSYRD